MENYEDLILRIVFVETRTKYIRVYQWLRNRLRTLKGVDSIVEEGAEIMGY
jgi:hypothetical protein